MNRIAVLDADYTLRVWIQRDHDRPFPTTLADLIWSNERDEELADLVFAIRAGRAYTLGGGAAELVTVAPGETLADAFAAPKTIAEPLDADDPVALSGYRIHTWRDAETGRWEAYFGDEHSRDGVDGDFSTREQAVEAARQAALAWIDHLRTRQGLAPAEEQQ